tara:strand:+ start:2599 stop:2994 length:396 start_codon:yes stop_codon:yes gene_type:complete
MTTEMMSLLTFAMTCLIVLLLQATIAMKAYGISYFMSNRDEAPAEESPLAQRFNRIVSNNIETGFIFVALVLVAAQTEVSNGLTVWGSIVFAAARIVYPVIYAAGIPVVRTLVWDTGIVALFVIFTGIVTA